MPFYKADAYIRKGLILYRPGDSIELTDLQYQRLKPYLKPEATAPEPTYNLIDTATEVFNARGQYTDLSGRLRAVDENITTWNSTLTTQDAEWVVEEE